MKDINFLLQYQQKLRQKAKERFVLQLFAFSLLIIYGLLMVGVFGFNFFLNQEKNKLEGKINEQKRKIESLVEVETKQIYLRNKTSNFKKIIDGLQDNQLIIEGFFALIPQGIKVDNFNVSENNKISFQVKAENFEALKQLFENIQAQKFGQKQIFAAEVNSMMWSDEGTYSFNLDLSLNPLPTVELKENNKG